ncbi:putative phage protein (TIGR02218 family) [Ancylobacter sp. 3268]|uniref:DUF2163 domain-containing protein n=1 Tax=Ancylobacter sp. 3268 TaxID=2817752 RepID=UPI0028564107|nr:DUF2163 domain-containing protein [Ancylobacter sp. 3268]MDR6952705.1 putative phage protein (TIGR02218 family) [Ancylobacter sp. 3268]
MRTLPTEFSAALATGATTLARCWRLTRRDGAVLGLTEHDGDLTVDGTLFLAAAGVGGSENPAALGFAAAGGELTGALAADQLDERDLAAGLYDGAAVDLLLVDWSNPASFIRLRRGHLGEVRRENGVFVAELRALSDALGQVRGRLFTRSCDADLGDARCRVDLAAPGLRGEGVVAAVEAAGLFRADGLDGFAADRFTQGRLAFTHGANQGFATEVKAHGRAGATVRLELWQRPPEPLAVGDAFTVTAGCDKRLSTCRDRFSNATNFRGMPHMPGNDAVVRIARPGAS